MFLSLQRTRCLLYTHNTNTSCLLCPSNWNQIISTLPHTQVPPLWNTVAWNSCSYLSRAMQWKTSLLVDSKSWQGKKKQIKSWLRGLKSSRSKPVECGRVWPLTSLNVLQDCCNLTAMKLSIIVCDSSSSCKYPVQGLTLIYSFPQSVLVHSILIFIQWGDDPRCQQHWQCWDFCWCYLYREKSNMHTVLNLFISPPFVRFFVSYWVLKLQVLIFGINVFLCVLFFFFKFWMFLLDYFFFFFFTVCTYLYNIYKTLKV